MAAERGSATIANAKAAEKGSAARQKRAAGTVKAAKTEGETIEEETAVGAGKEAKTASGETAALRVEAETAGTSKAPPLDAAAETPTAGIAAADKTSLETAGTLKAPLLDAAAQSAAANTAADAGSVLNLNPSKYSYRMLVAYDGTAYNGWQLQAGVNVPTIQHSIETALCTLLQVPREKLGVMSAGRTDRGVHARGQVVQFYSDIQLDTSKLSRRTCSLLPPDIRVYYSSATAPDFHVSISALKKVYHYTVDTGSTYDPLMQRFRIHFRTPLKHLGAMTQAAQMMVGEHDFAQFTNSQFDKDNKAKSTIKNILRVDIALLGLDGDTLVVYRTTQGAQEQAEKTLISRFKAKLAQSAGRRIASSSRRKVVSGSSSGGIKSSIGDRSSDSESGSDNESGSGSDSESRGSSISGPSSGKSGSNSIGLTRSASSVSRVSSASSGSSLGQAGTQGNKDAPLPINTPSPPTLPGLSSKPAHASQQGSTDQPARSVSSADQSANQHESRYPEPHEFSGVRIEVEGEGFLFRQVRHMSGALLAVGSGSLSLEDLAHKLHLGKRASPGQGGRSRGYKVADAKGLLLHSVTYPEGIDDPSRILYPELLNSGHGQPSSSSDL